MKNESQTEKKKKALAIHDKNVHVLVSELAKNDEQRSIKQPHYIEKKQRRKKVDVKALLDKEWELESNIFNIVIGEIISRENEGDIEKQQMKE